MVNRSFLPTFQPCLTLAIAILSFLKLQCEPKNPLMTPEKREERKKEAEQIFKEKIIPRWNDLTPQMQEDLAKAMFSETSPIQLPAEVLKTQSNSVENPQQFVDELISENKFKKGFVTLSPEVLKTQINSLENPQKFTDELISENKFKKGPVTLSPEVLTAQANALQNPEEFANKLLGENKFKKGDVTLSPEVLKKLIELEDPIQRERLIKDLLSKHYPEAEARQQLINKLIKRPKNKDLFPNLSEKDCIELGIQANPAYGGVSPVLDWLNTAHFKGFFQPTMTDILVNRNKFNEFDSFNQWGLWGECFGLYSKLEKVPKDLKLNMYTIGINIGGQKVFFERLVLGLGIGGSHSGVKWKEDRQDSSINSIYFGPSLNYVFSHGYLGCTLLGLVNFYKVNREVNLFPKRIKEFIKTTTEYQTWDLVARIEGGLSYEIWDQFYFYPTARVDYLNVFVRESSEKVDDTTEIKLDPFNNFLLCSKAGLKVTKEFFYENFGFLIPSLSGGWINFTPLSTPHYEYEIEAETNKCKKFEKEIEIGSWNQSYMGAGFTFVHERGILVSLDYEITIGVNSPVQGGSLRIEWSW